MLKVNQFQHIQIQRLFVKDALMLSFRISDKETTKETVVLHLSLPSVEFNSGVHRSK